MPNTVTSVRLLAIPLLWAAWLWKLETMLGVGLCICFISDLLDGLLARRLCMVTAEGERLDSLADHILIPSAVFWLVLGKRHAFFGKEWVLGVTLCLYLLTITIGVVKRKQFGGAHLFGSKVMGLGNYAFMIVTYLVSFKAYLFYVAIGTLAYFCVETSLYSFYPHLLQNRMKCAIIGLIGKDITPVFLEGLI